MVKKIAVLGGGVAGLTTAIALRSQGFDVEVYERHRSASTLGAGLILWPNAAFVLDQLSLMGELEAIAGAPTRMQRWSHAGENLGAIDIQAINDQMGYPSLSVLRRDFQQLLLSALDSLNVPVHYGCRVETIETVAPGRAAVHLDNGSGVDADLFVGADGRMGSSARRYVLRDGAPVYQGFVNWVGVFNAKQEVFQEIVVADYWGVGKRFGIVPISNNRAYWAGGLSCPGPGSRNAAQYKDELRAIFADWPDPVPLMIEGTAMDQINKIYVHDHEPSRVWHKHNLVMIGDAAHAPLPTSGQGACQALEDAWHLSRCLAVKASDLPQALEDFTKLRTEKTASITLAARGLASALFNRDPEYCAARNTSSKNTDFTAAARGMAGLWGQGLPLSARQSGL